MPMILRRILGTTTRAAESMSPLVGGYDQDLTIYNPSRSLHYTMLTSSGTWELRLRSSREGRLLSLELHATHSAFGAAEDKEKGRLLMESWREPGGRQQPEGVRARQAGQVKRVTALQTGRRPLNQKAACGGLPWHSRAARRLRGSARDGLSRQLGCQLSAQQ